MCDLLRVTSIKKIVCVFYNLAGVMNLLHTHSKKTADRIKKKNEKNLVRGLQQAKSDEEAKVRPLRLSCCVDSRSKQLSCRQTLTDKGD